ncbi:MAG TPA: divalent-cation tolerance protein CutA [Terracidiphilus sp.]|nr:divalent-cation tolerance protein CutA [Terracidiphilus sp.]
MLQTNPSARIVLTTTSDEEEAGRIGRTLVEERLAACATVLPEVHSIYRWQGEIESSTECLLLLKTAQEKLPALETRLHELHSYKTPEFLVLPIEAGSESYIHWLENCLRGA